MLCNLSALHQLNELLHALKWFRYLWITKLDKELTLVDGTEPEGMSQLYTALYINGKSAIERG